MICFTELPKNFTGIDFRRLSDKDRAKLGLAPLGWLDRELQEDAVKRAIRTVPRHYAQRSSYFVQNSALATTAAPVVQPTGTAIRTMMLLKAGSGQNLGVVEWGISFDGSAAATPGKCELFENTVAATMSTAYVNADIQRFADGTGGSQGDASNQPIDVTGTGTAGFATAAVTEGTVANYRGFDLQLLPPTAPYVKQWPLGREPDVVSARFLRVRVTFGTTVNCYIYVIFET
jgi:hypothetical protein